MKAGWKTSEFWLSTTALLLGQLYASGVISDGGTVSKVAGLAVSVLATLGYTVSRGAAKGKLPAPPTP